MFYNLLNLFYIIIFQNSQFYVHETKLFLCITAGFVYRSCIVIIEKAIYW